MRRIFQFEGIENGVLSVGECPDQDRVILVVSNGETEAQVTLSARDFRNLCGLQYTLRFPAPKTEPGAEDPALKAVA